MKKYDVSVLLDDDDDEDPRRTETSYFLVKSFELKFHAHIF